MATAPAAALAGTLGLLVGSFLNVVAHRLPRRISLLAPRSRCPACEAPIRPADNVPVLSWLLLRGRCRRCSETISVRYPLVELGTAALAIAVVADKGAGREVWLPLVLLALLVPITLIDLERRIIPNRIVGAGAVAAILIGALVDPPGLREQLIAGAAAGAFFGVAVLAHPAGMGLGDVKLAGMLGLFLGRYVAVAVLVALLAGTAVGVVVMARKGAREGRKTAIPFGPFLAFGGLVAILAGPALTDWWLGAF
jgi:leader peptidase (prepilin peptidase) / N-methyltransferase